MRKIVFWELDADQRATLTARQVEAWEYRRAGLTALQTSRRMGIYKQHVYRLCEQVRRRANVAQLAATEIYTSAWAKKSLTKIAELSDAQFERYCRLDQEKEEAEGLSIPGMRLQDFQRCAHCGLRGHLPEACDLPLVRGEIALGRRGPEVELGE